MEIKQTHTLLKIAFTAILIASSSIVAKDLTLWGKQTAGWGPGANAEVKGNTITLVKTAKIVKVEGTAKGNNGFCLWSNRRAVLCGGTDKKHSIVGAILKPGRYSVFPKVGTRVKIKLRYLNK